MTETQILAVVGGIATAIGTLIGGVSTALVMVWKGRAEVNRDSREQAHNHDSATIERLTKRVEDLEKKLDAAHQDHLECTRRQGVLEGKIAQLSEDLDRTIRRHDEATQKQIAMNREKIAELGGQV